MTRGAMRVRATLTAAATGTALLLSGCAGAPDDPPGPSSPSAEPSIAPPVATAEPAESQAPSTSDAPECDTIVTSGIVDALTAQGWTAHREEFRIGEAVFEGGLLCRWADYTTASDQGQMYGWAPIDDAASDAAQLALQQSGWLRSVEGGSVFLTEDPDFALATDEDGFGMTYEFGEGWVKLADTKQGLLLIDWD